ncbi:MAG: hypothetical protein ACLU0O_04125 [Collinsella sp.]
MVITSAVVNGTNAVIGYDHVAGSTLRFPLSSFRSISGHGRRSRRCSSAALWQVESAARDVRCHACGGELIESVPARRTSPPAAHRACLDVIDHGNAEGGIKPAGEQAARRAAWQASAYPRELRGPAGCVPLPPWSQARRRLRLRPRPRQDVRHGLPVGFPYIDILRYGGKPCLATSPAKVLLPRSRYTERRLAEIVDE